MHVIIHILIRGGSKILEWGEGGGA